MLGATTIAPLQPSRIGESDPAPRIDSMRRRSRFLRVRLAAVAACASILASPLPAYAADSVSVKVDRRGELVVIDVEARADAPIGEVWNVFTDYDRMAGFITSITSSRVRSRRGDALEVAQAGATKVMFMRFAFAGVRGVELVPHREIRSWLIEGDFKSLVSTTRFVEAGDHVRIVHHGEYAPKAWLPPLVGPAVIESATRTQYHEMLAEIHRRKAASTPR